MLNKRAQMEILGLAIVVVIILVATVFVVRFLVFKTPTNYRKGFVSSELASNMLSTFLKTNANSCSQLTMTELLQDCAQVGGEGSIKCSNGEYSCKYVESAAQEIFDVTFKKWNMEYEFLAYTDKNDPKINLGLTCKADKKSKLFPIPTGIGTMYVQLDICG